MKPIFLLLLFMPGLSFSQEKARAATVTSPQGRISEYLATDRDATTDPHRFILTDAQTGKKVIITPMDASLVAVAGGDSWTAAILDVDLTPADLAGLQASGSTGAPTSRKDTVFLLNEFSGAVVSLYSLQEHKRTHLFLTKQGGPFEELVHRQYSRDEYGNLAEEEDNEYRSQLAAAVKECPFIADQTQVVRFSGADIADLLGTYEVNCLKTSHVRTRADRLKGELAITPWVGYAFNRSGFVCDHPSDLVPPGTVKIPGTPSFGIGFIYHMPGINNKLALSVDLHYNSFKAKADTVRLAGGTSAIYTTKGLEYRISNIRSGLGMQFYLTDPGNFRPWIGGGLSLGFSPTHVATPIEYQFNSGALHAIPKKDPFQELGFQAFQYGFHLGAGVDFGRVGIQYAFENFSGYVTTIETGSSLKVHSFRLSYRIK